MFIYKVNCRSCSKDTKEYEKFIEWFIGFAEGDGSWEATNGRATFMINQKYPKVLYKIKNRLRFGRVTGPYTTSKGQKYYRYSVTNQTHVRELIQIFNGKFILKKTKERFKTHLKVYNVSKIVQQTESSIAFEDNNILPTLQDGWLSGFLDAEGSFSGHVRKDHSKISISVSLVQKGEKELFKYLKLLLGGHLQIIEKSKEQTFRLKIQAKDDRKRVIEYLDRYNLRSDKHISFCQFKKIHIRITTEEFSYQKLGTRAQERLSRLIKNINII
jgi:hypothetical protein